MSGEPALTLYKMTVGLCETTQQNRTSLEKSSKEINVTRDLTS